MRSAEAAVGVQFVPGTMLGKYELLATIGTGGMASVILARQRGPAGFEKVVVVKLVHPHMAQDQVAVNMLLDEAKVASQIDHQNVVHTYELGEANGTFYIVMEYLAGESLAQVIKAGRAGVPPVFDPYLAARIVADAAAGLHHAHDLKDFDGNPLEVVHRDVSPGNIVVLYNGSVKVVDFGIAKAQGRVTSTQDGELKGKYGYMSPEQIKNEPLDRRSDVFSLGVVLWEALAQKRLFQADNVAAILMQILGGERLPPSHYRPGIPPVLDAIALNALSPDPRTRFQSADEMKKALEDAIWQTRYGAAEISAHMTAVFADRLEQRRVLLARATREQLTQGDLATFGTAFKDPGSGIESKGAIRGLTNSSEPGAFGAPGSGREPQGAFTPTSSVQPHGTFRAPTPYPFAIGNTTGAPLAMSGAMAASVPPPRSNKRVAIILTLGVIVGIVAGIIVGFGGSDEPAKKPDTVAETTPGESPIAKAVKGENDLGTATTGAATTRAATTPTVPDTTETTPTVPTVPDPTETKPVVAETKPVVAETKPVVAETKPVVAETKPRIKETKPQIKETKPVVEPVAETRPTEIKPDKPKSSEQLWTKKATEAYLAGDFDGAQSYYKQALASNRGYAPAHKGLGFLYQRIGNKAKAIESLKNYLKLSPGAKDADSVRKRLEQLGGA